MAVILENFLKENEKIWTRTPRGKHAWKMIREELYKRRSVRNKDIPNDTVSKQILEGWWDWPDGAFLLSKYFRDYCRNNTEFIGNGGFPV